MRFQRPRPLFFALLLCTAATVPAQRGRGPSEFIRERSGSFFVDAVLPAPDPASKAKPPKIPLQKTAFVEANVQAGHLSLLYIYDSSRGHPKHKGFEQIIFGHSEIQTQLRAFKCARADIASDAPAKALFGDQAPLFVAFDAKGKIAGEASFYEYKAKGTPIIKLLERAARKHAKMSLANFVSQYRKFLRDYQVYEGRKKTLDQKRQRLSAKKKRSEAKFAALDKEEKALEDSRVRLLETEKKILAAAKIPERDPKAVRLGQRDRRR